MNRIDQLGLSWGSVLGSFVTGVAVGFVAAATATVAVVAVVAATVLPVAVVTAGLAVAAVYGASVVAGDIYGSAEGGNWDQVAYDVGTIGGGALFAGTGGGLATVEAINGVPSPAWSLASDASQGYNPALGSIWAWLATGTNPGSAGGTTALAGAGLSQVCR